MNRILIWLAFFIAGATAGVVAGVRLTTPSDDRRAVTRAPAPAKPAAPLALPPPVPKLTAEEARNHRRDHYQNMTSVADLLNLPTDFAQTEALYALAGRADTRQLEVYIEQAAGIANRYDRRSALQILYLRYAELAPDAALAYLEQSRLDIAPQVISSIFYSWAKIDINAAIEAANGIVNAQRRRTAGESILRTYRQIDAGMLKSVAARLIDTYDLTQHDAEALAVTANHSPQLALQQALALTSPQTRQQALYSIGTVWARNDPRAALAYAETISDRQVRDAFKNAVMNRWSSDDPRAAMETVLGLPDGAEKNRLMTSAIQNLAQHNPSEALRIADNLTGRARANAQQQIHQTWLRNDPDSALANIMALPDSAHKDQLIAIAGMHLARRQPSEALRWVNQLPEPQRAQTLRSILGQVAQYNPEEAYAAVMDMPPSVERTRILTSVINNMSYRQPEVAANYVSQLPAGQMRDQAQRQIAAAWAQRDADAALTFVAGLNDRVYREAIRQIGFQVAQNDPDAAVGYLSRIRDSAKTDWIGSIASAYAQSDPQRAIAFISRYANDPAHATMISSVVPQIARRDPAAALRLAEGLDDAARPPVVIQVLSQWAANDPAAAARWANTTPDARVREQAIPSIAGQWAQHDAAAARQWVMTLRAGTARDAALVSMVGSSEHSTGELLKLVGAIESEEHKIQAISSAYLRLRQHSGDHRAARDFLERAGVSAAQRRALESRAGGG